MFNCTHRLLQFWIPNKWKNLFSRNCWSPPIQEGFLSNDTESYIQLKKIKTTNETSVNIPWWEVNPNPSAIIHYGAYELSFRPNNGIMLLVRYANNNINYRCLTKNRKRTKTEREVLWTHLIVSICTCTNMEQNTIMELKHSSPNMDFTLYCKLIFQMQVLDSLMHQNPIMI